MVNIYILLLVAICVPMTMVKAAWGKSNQVLLKDIDVLTLYAGKFTAGGRSSPVLQLDCVEAGTASCSAFRPKVVQCYNRGFDGIDVQWECKTDMDNAFRFGTIEVSCEGYSHPDDPYILAGSCGLKYSIDYTQEGLDKKNPNSQHNYYGNDDNQHGGSFGYYQSTKVKSSSASWFADLIVYCAVALMCYALYKTCSRSSRATGQDAYSTTNDDYPAGGGHNPPGTGYGWFGGGATPPPTAPPHTGFNQQYPEDASCRRNQSSQGAAGTGATGATGSGGGGFWTGAATGGLLGYMFGQRGGGGYGQNYGGYGSSGWGRSNSGWGGSNSGWGGSSGGAFGGGRAFNSGGSSSGTRTSSGFGGTSRR